MRRTPVVTAFADSGADPVAHSTVRMHVPLEFPVGVEIVARNRSGLLSRRHGLDLAGWVHMPELGMELMFRGDHPAQDRPAFPLGAARVVPSGLRLPIPPLAIDRVEPERRDLWVLTSEPQRQPPWLAHYAGRGDQRVITFGRQVRAKATLDLSCCVDESLGVSGAKVEIWGDITFDQPLTVRLELKDADRVADESREMTVIASGSRVPVLRQSLWAPARPDPWIVMRVSDREGRVVSPGRALGDHRRAS